MSMSLSVEKALAGRHILFTGASGFLGKVWLSMMLDKVPQVGRIYVLLRGKQKQGARERFERMIDRFLRVQGSPRPPRRRALAVPWPSVSRS